MINNPKVEQSDKLPIMAILDDVLTALQTASNAVIIAPPGAGKTTNVAPALISQSWNKGQILLLSPRRLAARSAATFIAAQLGENIGDSIGYATRNDSVQGPHNKILVMTEGIFRNKIIADPTLEGISAVLFDEVHERSLDSDFGLALALEAQEAFRPDLRLIAMSATLDGERFSDIMQGAPLFQSEGKSYPLNIHYMGRAAERSIEEDIAINLRKILADNQYKGDILIFLPGVREIDTLANLLPQYDDIIIHKLHGNIDPKAQREAIKIDAHNRRKIILATNIAETSLTIDGVRIVIDSGMVRRARYDRAANITRLVTEKSSLASSVQRSGRAARQGEGHAFRLWREAANGGLPPFDPPEILECDLSGLLLDCALWGEYHPENLSWLDAPPKAGLDQAKKQLLNLGLWNENGQISATGKCAAALPMPPHLANMLLLAQDKKLASSLILLIQEYALGGRDIDIEERLRRAKNDRGAKAKFEMAQRWTQLADKIVAHNKDDFIARSETRPISIGAMIACAFPDRLAKRQTVNGENWLGVGGKRYFLDIEKYPNLAQSEWLAIADVRGSAAKSHIISAAKITYSEVESLFADKISDTINISHDSKADRIDAGYVKSLGAIIIGRGHSAAIEMNMIAQALLQSVKSIGLSLLPWSKTSLALRQRAQYAGEEIISECALMTALDEWLLPILDGKRRIAQIDSAALHQALENYLGWDAMQRINNIAPAYFNSNDGKYPIDYHAKAGPTAQMRVQALYGMKHHPTIGRDKVPLILSLTSPAGRPIQTTKNLPEFWAGSWHDVAKEMRGRYPKHHWPDDPMDAVASLKTKKRQNLK